MSPAAPLLQPGERRELTQGRKHAAAMERMARDLPSKEGDHGGTPEAWSALCYFCGTAVSLSDVQWHQGHKGLE